MPHLPNEIWDQIWLERCQLGFEPRILQPQWVRDGRFHVPAFYAAQSQAFMTQLCHGARRVAAKGFYSRISDNPLTGQGGFWWHEKDVLYVDQDFYRMLRTPRRAIFMGREHITRVAVDINIDAGPTAVAELLLDWFPMLSQLFYLCSARLTPASQPEDFVSLISRSRSRRWIYPKPAQRLRLPNPVVSESASTKSCPIISFWEMGPNLIIPTGLFIRAQGLIAKLRKAVHREAGYDLTDYFHGDQGIPFFVFERDDRPQAISVGGSLDENEGTTEESMTLEELEDHVTRQSKMFLHEVRQQYQQYKQLTT
ncbi:hypothetical protein SLS64_008832 [Diaporthe eres]|uniref:Uncharacterized protein n=1 Tax=Diaporthe eres TaxID=83184 RepID=A0ABR1P4Q8_DIAER